MSYEYAGTLFTSPRDASRAAVSAFLYPGGRNSLAAVAAMSAEDATEQLLDAVARGDWEVPYLDAHTLTIADMVREIIGEARKEHRDELADEILCGCPDEAMADHEAIAAALRRGDSAEAILGMPEVAAWPETYVWLKGELNA